MNKKCTAWPSQLQLYRCKYLKIWKKGTVHCEWRRGPGGKLIQPLGDPPPNHLIIDPTQLAAINCSLKYTHSVYTLFLSPEFCLCPWLCLCSCLSSHTWSAQGWRLAVNQRRHCCLTEFCLWLSSVVVFVFLLVFMFSYTWSAQGWRLAVNQRGHRCLTASFPPICSQGSTLQLAPVIKSVFCLLFFSLKIALVFTPLTSVCNDIPSKQWSGYSCRKLEIISHLFTKQNFQPCALIS